MIYSKLTPEQKAAYLKDSCKCPHCQAGNFEGGEIQADGESHYQNISCNECGREWVEIYGLVEVDDGEQVCDDCNQIIQEGDEVEEDENGGFCHVKCPDDSQD